MADAVSVYFAVTWIVMVAVASAVVLEMLYRWFRGRNG